MILFGFIIFFFSYITFSQQTVATLSPFCQIRVSYVDSILLNMDSEHWTRHEIRHNIYLLSWASYSYKRIFVYVSLSLSLTRSFRIHLQPTNYRLTSTMYQISCLVLFTTTLLSYYYSIVLSSFRIGERERATESCISWQEHTPNYEHQMEECACYHYNL